MFSEPTLTLNLTQTELNTLTQLLDAATRHLGRAAAKPVAMFEYKIEQAVQAFNEEEERTKIQAAVDAAMTVNED